MCSMPSAALPLRNLAVLMSSYVKLKIAVCHQKDLIQNGQSPEHGLRWKALAYKLAAGTEPHSE